MKGIYGLYRIINCNNYGINKILFKRLIENTESTMIGVFFSKTTGQR